MQGSSDGLNKEKKVERNVLMLTPTDHAAKLKQEVEAEKRSRSFGLGGVDHWITKSMAGERDRSLLLLIFFC